MGVMLDDTINMGKEPLHRSLDVVPPGVDADAGDSTLTIHEPKRGKVFQPRSPPPSLGLEPDDEEYPLCQECPTSVDDGAPFEWRDVEARRVPAGAPADASRASSLPTADDYANIFFCETYEEEEEFRAGRLAVEEPSSPDDAAPLRATAPATSATSPSSTSTKQNRKRRRVSFGESAPTVHLLTDVPPCRTMTPKERSALWLSRSDLKAFKSSGMRSVQAIRGRVAGNDGDAAISRRSKLRALMVEMENETGSSVRGLEHRVFRKKQLRQDLIRDVLECQSHVKGLAKFGHAMEWEESSRLLARASRDRSLKARKVAFLDARDDRREVCAADAATGGGGVDSQRTLKRPRRGSGVISL